jgi:hypothetical protein
MFKDLLRVMSLDPGVESGAATHAEQILADFLQHWAAEKAFCKYFKDKWGDKLGEHLQSFSGQPPRW